MRVEELALEQFRCFPSTRLALEPGVTVVHGVNGSGKTTLLDGIFFALYGADALDDQTLEDVITIGAEAASVQLSFTHAGETFTIEREIRERGERATTTSCTLTPAGGDPIEGVTAVTDRVESLLRMDASAFVNCAYVRQGEVNTLIHASPAERQDMIDDLLQLGALERYRDRAGDARLGVQSVLTGQREVLDSIQDQIEAIEDEDPHAQLNERESEKRRIEAELAEAREDREALLETIDTAEDELESLEEAQSAIISLEEAVESIRETITETETEREALSETLREHREERSTLESDLAEYRQSAELGGTSVADRLAELDEREANLRDELEEHRTTISRHQDEQDRLEAEREELTETIAALEDDRTELEDAIETDASTLEAQREELSSVEQRIETLRANFEEAPVPAEAVSAHRSVLTSQREGVTAARSETATRIEALEDAIDERESLAAAGQCPTCGQSVEDAPHVHDLEEHRAERERLEARHDALGDRKQAIDAALERARDLESTARELTEAESERERLTAVIEEREAARADRQDRLEALETEIEARQDERSELADRLEDLEAAIATEREAIGDVNGRRSDLTGERETLEAIQKTTDAIETLEDDMAAIRDRRASLAELNEERRTRLTEKQTELREQREAVDEARIEQIRSTLEDARADLAEVEDRIESLEERRDAVQSAIGAATQAIESLEEHRERLAEAEERVERLTDIHAEAETLEGLYSDLRSSLRQRNVATLERLVNETFDLLYRNDAYASIELDGDYALTVYQKDGEPIAPERLSGGERALFNLSLRCAIYRLLAEGEHGSAPMPPLILDEPTVYLDDGHVTQLLELVDAMRSMGVEQIVVVSHDEELVGAADRHVLVEKDPTSNRSRIVRADPVSIAQP